MKNLFFTILCLFIYIKVDAQNAKMDSKDEQMTTLFEYGETVVSPEVNFENLFKHFTLFVSGGDVTSPKNRTV